MIVTCQCLGETDSINSFLSNPKTVKIDHFFLFFFTQQVLAIM